MLLLKLKYAAGSWCYACLLPCMFSRPFCQVLLLLLALPLQSLDYANHFLFWWFAVQWQSSQPVSTRVADKCLVAAAATDRLTRSSLSISRRETAVTAVVTTINQMISLTTSKTKEALRGSLSMVMVTQCYLHVCIFQWYFSFPFLFYSDTFSLFLKLAGSFYCYDYFIPLSHFFSDWQADLDVLLLLPFPWSHRLSLHLYMSTLCVGH